MNQQIKEEIHALWDTLAGYSVSENETAIAYLLKRFCELFDAEISFLAGSVCLNPSIKIQGWRPHKLYRYANQQDLQVMYFHDLPYLPGLEDGYSEKVKKTYENVGKFRGYHLRGGMVSEAYFSTPDYQFSYTEQNTHDSLLIICPINDYVELCYSVQRHKDKPFFNVTDLENFQYLLRSMQWFHRQSTLTCGIHLHQNPLTSAEAKILPHLLNEESLPDVAQKLNKSVHTVRDHSKSIYDKYGVSGRTGLMELWLNPLILQSFK